MAKFKKVVINIVSGCIWNREARHRVRKKLSEFQYSEYREFLRFKMGRVRKKSVLLMEFNPFHGEVLAGIIKYFYALGYNVDVAANEYLLKEKPLCRMGTHNIKTYAIYESTRALFMRTRHINKYDHVFLMTGKIYSDDGIFDNLAKIIYKPRCSMYLIEHDTSRLKLHEKASYKINGIVMLGKFPGATFVNAHNFGDIKLAPKHKKTTFVVVGNIVPFRKNFDLLVDAVTKLARAGLDFRVVCIGSGTFPLPDDVRPFIETTGRLNFPDMFAQMEAADFFLPLLDPTNPDHDRYITTGVTGSAQLIYGFAKVPLIHEKFAPFYRFDKNNAIIYTGDNLSTAMQAAISMSDTDYEKIRNNLRRTTRQIWDESLGNLAGILKK